MKEKGTDKSKSRKVLKLSVNPSLEMGLKSHSQTQSKTAKGSVVVITKGSTKEEVSHASDTQGSLTENEKKRRLDALQEANERKVHSSADHHATSIIEEDQVAKDQNISVENQIEEDHEINTESDKKASVESIDDNIQEKEKFNENIDKDADNNEGKFNNEVEKRDVSSNQLEDTKIEPVDKKSTSSKDIEVEKDEEDLLLKSKKHRIKNLNKVEKKVIKEEDEEENNAAVTTEPKSVLKKQQMKNITKSMNKVDVDKISVEDTLQIPGKKIKDNKRFEKRKFSSSKLVQFAFNTSDEDDEGFSRSKSRIKKRRKADNKQTLLRSNITYDILIPEHITVRELASSMATKASNVIKALMNLGVVASLDQSIDADTAELIAHEFGHNPKRIASDDIIESLVKDTKDSEQSLSFRAPVVTVMGHVDHGKTSLLDALRSTDVAAKEHGSITQHIGAYKVTLQSGKFITFLDTPGHEVFASMRMRGAQITDIVVLVVAADDGIKPQTIEAINHAKAAEVPIIVAINKIDIPNCNINIIKNSLLNHSIIPDDMGGDTMVIGVSAKEGTGLDKLEEAILLQADFLNLRANYDRAARGRVVESRIHKSKGILSTFLVQNGTLNVGDVVVAGKCYGKVRVLIDDKGVYMKNKGAIPSSPVEITGLNDIPIAGDEFIVVADEKTAKQIVELRIDKKKRAGRVTSKVTTEQLFQQVSGDAKKRICVIIKADVQGSVEAILHSLEKLSSPDVQLKILHSGVGGVTESDVALAVTSNAMILGFNVRANSNALYLIEKSNIEIHYHTIIYDLIKDVKTTMEGLLKPAVEENVTGRAEVRKVFDIGKIGKIAGCYVILGIIKRSSNARLLRDGVIVHSGKIKSIKKNKEDAKEVKVGVECGIALDRYDNILEGDIIEAFEYADPLS